MGRGAEHRPARKPLRYVINTTEHPEHTGGNAVIAAKGRDRPAPRGQLHRRSDGKHQLQAGVGGRASERAQPDVGADRAKNLRRLPEAWPDNTYAIDQKRFYFNDEPVVMMNYPGNTDGNTVVFFRKSDVISTGDLLDLTRYPLIDLKAGGSIAGHRGPA